MVLCNLQESQLEFYRNNMDNAARLINEALQKSESCENHMILRIRALYVRSGICRKMKQYDDATKFLQEAYSVRQQP